MSIAIIIAFESGYYEIPIDPFLGAFVAITVLWLVGFFVLRDVRELLVSEFHDNTSDHQFTLHLLSVSTRETYESYYSEYREKIRQIERKYESELAAAVKLDSAEEAATAKEDPLTLKATAGNELTKELDRFRWELMKSEHKHLYLLSPNLTKSPYLR